MTRHTQFKPIIQIPQIPVAFVRPSEVLRFATAGKWKKLFTSIFAVISFPRVSMFPRMKSTISSTISFPVMMFFIADNFTSTFTTTKSAVSSFQEKWRKVFYLAANLTLFFFTNFVLMPVIRVANKRTKRFHINHTELYFENRMAVFARYKTTIITQLLFTRRFLKLFIAVLAGFHIAQYSTKQHK